MASTPAHKRSRIIAAAASAAIACLSSAATLTLAASPAAASGPGGTQAAGAPVSTSSSGGAVPSAPGVPRTPSTSAPPVRIASASCVPAARCSGNPHQVSVHGTLLLAGPGLRAGMIVAFPSSPGARISRASPSSHLRQSSAGLIVTVPRTAHSGHIMVLYSRTGHTRSFGPIYIFNHPLHPPAPVPALAPAGGAVGASPLDGQGMWIWYVSRSAGGSVPAIIAQAHAAGVGTLFVKSSDGSSNYWGQFSPQLVAELHAAGLKACAWQYVYGSVPTAEADLGARAVAAGADCLVIDAETEYEGRYSAAQAYVQELRAKVGPSYPVALASFPYVSYHSSFPYSVFLGPGGAQYNAPQMYWKAIGQSVDTVYANTFIANRIYGRPIFPLGQTYEGPSPSDLLRFREEAVLYGATGVSFWDWQETGPSGWSALAAPLSPLAGVTPDAGMPELHEGSRGDPVLWMQEHLASAIPAQETTGYFGAQTASDLASFQTAHGIAASGVTDAATWAALLALAPVAVSWTGHGPTG